MKFYSIALVAALATAKDLKTVDILEAEQIIDGLVKGAIDAENLKDFTVCGGDLSNVTKDAKTVVADFKAGGAKNIMSGLETVADMLLWARSTQVDCNPKTSADW